MLRDDRSSGEGPGRAARNVLGEALEICSIKPMTGFYRDGCCNTGREDVGSHTVCVVMTDAFLAFSKSRGNDLSTPIPEMGFAGLKAGDIIVGLNAFDVRDQRTLMPMLKEFKPGDGITFKLRRGEQYLQLALTLGRRGAPLPATRPAATTKPSAATKPTRK